MIFGLLLVMGSGFVLLVLIYTFVKIVEENRENREKKNNFRK